MSQVSGFNMGSFPCHYLSVPLHVGRLTSKMLTPLVQKIRDKISGWKGKLLSDGEKLVLLHQVLSSLSLYLLFIVKVSNVVMSQIVRVCVHFFYGDFNGKPKKKWVS